MLGSPGRIRGSKRERAELVWGDWQRCVGIPGGRRAGKKEWVGGQGGRGARPDGCDKKSLSKTVSSADVGRQNSDSLIDWSGEWRSGKGLEAKKVSLPGKWGCVWGVLGREGAAVVVKAFTVEVPNWG